MFASLICLRRLPVLSLLFVAITLGLTCAPSGAAWAETTAAWTSSHAEPPAAVATTDKALPTLLVTRQWGPSPERPFRLGMQRLNPALDKEKQLAAFDPAGYVINSGILIGGFADQWIGGMALATRRFQWWVEAKASLTAPPGSFGSSVVLGTRDGHVMRIDALSGKVLWTANLDYFTERPFLLSGTTLYAVTAAQGLYALDFQTGKTLWIFDGGFPEGLTIRGGARPVVYENKVIYGTAAGELIAVAADSGKLVWRYNPAYNTARFHDVVGEMVLRGGRLFISRYDGIVAAIDLAGSVRKVLWQETLPGVTTSVFRGDRYYVGCLNGDVFALDPDNLRKVWRKVTGVPVTTLTAGETSLFIGGTAGRITALQASTGNVLWADQLGSSIATPPLVEENVLYYSTGMKNLYAYKMK
ncbi:MAG: PQQ-binding-like beta-propeller repeat protein [Proteobacteria bacterium]|nr:PQQ-binding-like beta-propeller repeat protein [Pseudomonadota bacterium]